MKTEIKVKLTFSNFDITPEEMSEKLGLKASKILKKDQPGPLTKKLIKSNIWELDSGLNELENFENHIKVLFQKIQKHKNNFIKVCNKHHPVLSCIIYIYGKDRPWIGFSKTTIKNLAEINASVDFDIYIL